MQDDFYPETGNRMSEPDYDSPQSPYFEPYELEEHHQRTKFKVWHEDEGFTEYWIIWKYWESVDAIHITVLEIEDRSKAKWKQEDLEEAIKDELLYMFEKRAIIDLQCF